jgi:CRISPR-associated protein Cas1
MPSSSETAPDDTVPDDTVPVVPSAEPSRTLYVDTGGAIVRKRSGRIVVEKSDGEDREEVLALPAVDIERVVLVGRACCTSPAQRFFLERGIDTTFLSRNGRLEGHLQAAGLPRPALRRAQYWTVEAPPRRLALARSFARAKLTNQRTLLRRYARRRSAPSIDAGADDVDALLGRVSACDDLDALRGVEGQATRRYFDTWGALIQRGDEEDGAGDPTAGVDPKILPPSRPRHVPIRRW